MSDIQELKELSDRWASEGAWNAATSLNEAIVTIRSLERDLQAERARADRLAEALNKAKTRLLEMQAMLGWDMALPVEKRKILPDYIAGEIDTALAAHKQARGE